MWCHILLIEGRQGHRETFTFGLEDTIFPVTYCFPFTLYSYDGTDETGKGQGTGVELWGLLCLEDIKDRGDGAR